MLKNLSSQQGLSLFEIVLASGVAVAVGLGALKMIQNSENQLKSIEKTSDAKILETMISKKLLSNEGCQQLKSLNIDDDVELRKVTSKEVNADGSLVVNYGDVVYAADTQIGSAKVERMYIKELKRLDVDESGIMVVEMDILTKNKSQQFDADEGSRRLKKQVMIPVLIDGAGQVTECQTQKVDLYEKIKEHVCANLFVRDSGEPAPNLSEPVTCADMMLYAQLKIKQEICLDLTNRPTSVVFPIATNGAGEIDLYNQSECATILTHVGKGCANPGEYLYGFSADGDFLCR